MSHKGIMMILLVLVTALLGIVVIAKNSDKHKGMYRKEAIVNWQWDNQWSDGNLIIAPPKIKIDPNKTEINVPEKKEEVKPEYNEHIVLDSYPKALEASVKTGKPILVFFTADWCGACNILKSFTLTNSEVVQRLDNYIVVYLNVDETENKAVSRKYGVQSLPTFVMINSDEKVEKRGVGSMGSTDFINWLENNPTNRFVAVRPFRFTSR